MEKKELKKEIEQLKKKLHPLQVKLRKMRDKEEKVYAKSLVGECFVLRDKEWGNTYYKVIGPDEWGVLALSIDKSKKNGQITISTQNLCIYDTSRTPNDYDKISKKVFNTQYDKMLTEMGLRRDG